MVGISKQQLAIRSSDVGQQPGTATGGVDPAQHVAAQPGRGHRAQHGRRVAEQRADMQRTTGVGKIDQRRRLARGLGKVLAPGPGLIAVRDSEGVVAHPGSQQLLHGLKHRLAPADTATT